MQSFRKKKVRIKTQEYFVLMNSFVKGKGNREMEKLGYFKENWACKSAEH